MKTRDVMLETWPEECVYWCSPDDLIIRSSYKRFFKFRKKCNVRFRASLRKMLLITNLLQSNLENHWRETETNCGLMSLFSCECAKVFSACLCASRSFVLTPGPTDQTITGACSGLHAMQRDSAYKSK